MMRGNLVTMVTGFGRGAAGFAKLACILLLAAGVAGCWSGRDSSPIGERGTTRDAYPANYRAELLPFFRTYLNDPTGVRDAALAEPVVHQVDGHGRYIVCVRYNARDSRGQYKGVEDRAAVYVAGRFDRLVTDIGSACAAAAYMPFPELENLQR